MRQIAVKDSDSHSWFTVCNQLLYKYNLPNIYIMQQQFSSEVSYKQEIKAQVDSFVAELCCPEAKIRITLQCLNIDSCKVGEVHPCWKTVANSLRNVRSLASHWYRLSTEEKSEVQEWCCYRSMSGPRIGFILLPSVMRSVLSDKVISQF